MTFFTEDPSVIRMGATYLRIDALVFYAYVVLFAHVAALQGMKRPMVAVWIGLYRQIVAPFVLFWALIRVFDAGLQGIWWGIFGVTWSAALFTLFYARRFIGRESGTP
jgi:Na+-driven multidrug efflux pump